MQEAQMGASSVHEADRVYVHDVHGLYTYTCRYVRTYIARHMHLSNDLSTGENPGEFQFLYVAGGKRG